MAEPCHPNTHDWRANGPQRQHAKIGRTWFVFPLRCQVCGQDGFQKAGSLVVYTWAKGDALEQAQD